jgi:hypothetical protein
VLTTIPVAAGVTAACACSTRLRPGRDLHGDPGPSLPGVSQCCSCRPAGAPSTWTSNPHLWARSAPTSCRSRSRPRSRLHGVEVFRAAACPRVPTSRGGAGRRIVRALAADHPAARRRPDPGRPIGGPPGHRGQVAGGQRRGEAGPLAAPPTPRRRPGGAPSTGS